MCIIKFALLCVVFGVSFGAPMSDEFQAGNLNFNNDGDEQRNYNNWFKTSNGIEKREQGTVRNAGLPYQYIDVIGEYSYTDPEGKLVVLRYRADDTGFHILPAGRYISKPLRGEVPPAVLATLVG